MLGEAELKKLQIYSSMTCPRPILLSFIRAICSNKLLASSEPLVFGMPQIMMLVRTLVHGR